MLVIGYTHRLQFELNPDLVFYPTQLAIRKQKQKYTFSTYDKIMYVHK